MRLQHIITRLRHGAAYYALCIVHCALISSCSDWTDHYDDTLGGGATAGTSLYQQIATRGDLSDFRRVLDATHVYTNNRITPVRYSDVLQGDQFYTVFALQNGTFNCDSLLQLCATQEGDSLVGLHFLGNHIARYRHSAGGNEQVLMANGKTQHLRGYYMGGAPISEANTPARNGILHVLQTDYQYRYNIYEALVSLDKYSHVGNFLRSYQRTEFEPTLSLEQGIVDGKTVYADSVFVNSNIILSSIDRIDSEDSTFIMFMPSASLWNTVHAEAKQYFNYIYDDTKEGDQALADSMQNLYSHYSLIQDLVFNPLWQTSSRDSLTTTTWFRGSYPYHVYYRPFEPGGLMSYVTDSTVCSNGVIYEMEEWPFDKTKLYFKKIEREAEGMIYQSEEPNSKTALSIERVTEGFSADSVSGGFISISPVKDYNPYYVEYEIPGVLSGSYDVKVIYLPKTVVDPSLDPTSTRPSVRKSFRRCKFIASIYYQGTDGDTCVVTSRDKYVINPDAPSYYVKDDGGSYVMECDYTDPKSKKPETTRAFTTNPYCVDTVQLCTFHFPVCNYAKPRSNARVRITNAVTSSTADLSTTTGFSANMLIDKIMLIPHKDETQE